MNNLEHENTDAKNAVGDTRAARAAVSRQTDGFARLGRHLQQLQEEYRMRTGRFATLPTEQPLAVREAIERAEVDDEPIIDEIRAIRTGLAEKRE